MLKKSISLLLALIMVFGIFTVIPFPAFAATSGTTGDCTWTLDGTVLTISGNGNMADYNIYSETDRAPWYDNRNRIITVVINSGVEIIGSGAFYSLDNVESIVIPDTVIKIGDNAIRYCSSLRSISIPDSVVSIGKYSLFNCKNLNNVIIGNSVTNIGDEAFCYCKGLTSVTIPISVISIGNSAFDSCPNLVDVYYNGSEEDWNSIVIGTNNDSLTSATIHFDYGLEFSVLGETFTHNLQYYSKYLDSTQYSPELAHLMMTMANAAYTLSDVQQGYDQLGLTRHNWKFYDERYDDYGTEKAPFYMGYTMGDDGTKCILVTIRGSGDIIDFSQGFMDWLGNASNLWLCEYNGYKVTENFYNTMQNVYEGLDEYTQFLFNKHIKDLKDVKLFITGHSRGAAVANLLEIKIGSEIGKHNVYGYNFAVPNVVNTLKSKDLQYGYENICNISNIEDPVSYLPSDEITYLAALSTYGTIPDKYKSIGWRKFGLSICFSDGNIDVKNYSDYKKINLEIEKHMGYIYLDYMRQRKSLSEYAESDGVHEYWNPYEYDGDKMYTVCCPVNVELIDENGLVIVSIIDDEINYTEAYNGKESAAVFDDKKVFVVPKGKNYTLKIVGYDSGTMDYYIERFGGQEEGVTCSKSFEGVALEIGKEMVGKTVNVIDSDDQMIQDDKLITVGDEPMEILTDGEEISYSFRYILGDADNNGKVEVIDAAWLQRHIAGIESPYDLATILQADVDYNGEPEITDVTMIQCYLAQIAIPYLIGADVV